MSTDQRRHRSNWVALGIVGTAVVAATLLTTSNALSAPPTAPRAAAAPAAPSAAKPDPQPTKTATIKGKQELTIKPDLAATVTAVSAVQGKAQGPGEIAGPAVQFTIAITNETGKPFDLANTVVNAYYGTAATPASPLEQEAGRPFPKKLKDGETVTGVFVFTIPEDQRQTVLVTVDTSVQNPVVAFRGPAPV